MAETFATSLRSARRNARDPQRGGQLTQERFAELVSESIGRNGFPTSATVSNWERGNARPSSFDRIVLYSIVAVLLRCEGLADTEAVNMLLVQGGYAPLTQAEAQSIKDLMVQN